MDNNPLILLFFILFILSLLCLTAIELQRVKCKHIEIGPVTHDLPLDVEKF